MFTLKVISNSLCLYLFLNSLTIFLAQRRVFFIEALVFKYCKTVGVPILICKYYTRQ